jgi:D-alanyl-D-alanine carboxypeptidase/D-alanyl-D-alanine-endopeptidase (penicillin-binding protein 4)
MAGGRRRWTAGLAIAAVAIVAAVPAVVLHRMADDDDAAAAAAATTTAPAATTAVARPSVATPLLSARRVPGVVTGKLSTASLRTGAAAVGEASPAPSCLLVTVDGAPVYEQRADVPVTPASNQKLITAAVALDVLGPDHRFTTSVLAPKPSDGVVKGDLTIVGGGDATLATQPYLSWLKQTGQELQDPHTSYEALADAIVAAGVRQIRGSVVGSDSRYDAQRRVASWPASYKPSSVGGPLSALLVNDGYSSFTPPRSTPDPAAQAAATMTALLQARGVTVAGAARSGPAPSGVPQLTKIDSGPLTDVLREMLTSSDNNTAELLLKELGLARGGAGTTAAGAQVVLQTLTGWGIPTAGVVVADGSGLDRGNRTTCRVLVSVLQHGGAPLAAGLAVAGQTGTLADAFRSSAVKGKLLAKTGTLTGVKSLTGELPVTGHDLTFSYVVNAPNAAAVAAAQWGRLGAALASFPDATPLGPFLPKPVAGS